MEFHVFFITKWESWTFQNGEVDGNSPSFGPNPLDVPGQGSPVAPTRCRGYGDEMMK